MKTKAYKPSPSQKRVLQYAANKPLDMNNPDSKHLPRVSIKKLETLGYLKSFYGNPSILHLSDSGITLCIKLGIQGPYVLELKDLDVPNIQRHAKNAYKANMGVGDYMPYYSFRHVWRSEVKPTRLAWVKETDPVKRVELFAKMFASIQQCRRKCSVWE